MHYGSSHQQNALHGSEHLCQTGCERSGTANRPAAKSGVLHDAIATRAIRDRTTSTTAHHQHGSMTATQRCREAGIGSGSTLGGSGPVATFCENSIVEAVDTPRCRYRHPYAGTWSARQREQTGSDSRPCSGGSGLRGTRRLNSGVAPVRIDHCGSAVCDGSGCHPSKDFARDFASHLHGGGATQTHDRSRVRMPRVR
jgi:hypothetical protein